MKILFICGSIEAGCDGVGDYTRELAKELVCRGWLVGICAVCDRYCEDIQLEGDVLMGGVGILRFPLSVDWSKKAMELQIWSAKWSPDIVSLQYVPYSFNARGLPWGFSRWLKLSLGSEVRWHIMFHELWVGITRKSPWRHRLIGALQKKIAQRMVQRLDPVVCHTINVLYTVILSRAGIKANRLPLFSSISIDGSEKSWMSTELARLGIHDGNRDQWWIVGLFGSCYPDYPLERQATEVLGDATAQSRKLLLLGIGGGVGTGAHWEAKVQAAVPSAVVCHFGRQSAARISAFLSVLNYGLSASPREFLGKSSAAAALHSHGVPLDDRYYADLPEYRDCWRGGVPDSDLFWSVERVANQMCLDL